MPDVVSGIFGFALMTAFWPGIGGAATTPRWDVGVLLAVALFFLPRIRLTAAHWIGLLLIGWLLLSLLWSDGQFDGINEEFQLVIVAVAFAVGSTLIRPDGLVTGAALGLGISSALAMAQWFGWTDMLWLDPNYALANSAVGLFYNRDTLAAVAALVMIAAVALRRWWLVPLLLPALLLTHSRAAWLALATALVLTRFRIEAVTWGLRIAAVVSGAAILALRDGPSTSERVMIWRDTIADLNVFGHGLGSFRNVFLQHAHFFDIAVQHSRPEHPHNEWLWLGFEGGIPAFTVALVLAGCLWRACEDHPERAVLVGLSVLSLFAMPFHDPATVVFASLVAGHLAAGAVGVCDGAVGRGSAVRTGLEDPGVSGLLERA